MALQELSRRKPLLANRTSPEVEALIVELSLELPANGRVRIANERRKRGPSLSPAGVRGVGQRNALETMKNRLKALETKVAHYMADAFGVAANHAARSKYDWMNTAGGSAPSAREISIAVPVTADAMRSSSSGVILDARHAAAKVPIA